MQPDKNNTCTICQNGTQINKESSPSLTIIYFTCGHQHISIVVNKTIKIIKQINQNISKDYEELGSMHLGGPLSAKVETPEEKGHKIFDGLHEELFEIICVKHKACEKMANLTSSETLVIIDVLTGIIAGVLGNPLIPCVTIVRIIVKRGIKNFCNCK